MDQPEARIEALHRAVAFALETYPERVEMLPLDELVIDSARANAKRPAYVKIAVPDEVVKSLRGPKNKRTLVHALISLPADVAERSQSRIILPGK